MFILNLIRIQRVITHCLLTVNAYLQAHAILMHILHIKAKYMHEKNMR